MTPDAPGNARKKCGVCGSDDPYANELRTRHISENYYDYPCKAPRASGETGGAVAWGPCSTCGHTNTVHYANYIDGRYCLGGGRCDCKHFKPTPPAASATTREENPSDDAVGKAVADRNRRWEFEAVTRALDTGEEPSEIRGYPTEELNEYARTLRRVAEAARNEKAYYASREEAAKRGEE